MHAGSLYRTHALSQPRKLREQQKRKRKEKDRLGGMLVCVWRGKSHNLHQPVHCRVVVEDAFAQVPIPHGGGGLGSTTRQSTCKQGVPIPTKINCFVSDAAQRQPPQQPVDNAARRVLRVALLVLDVTRNNGRRVVLRVVLQLCT